jgi:uncharacterized protein YjbJ (UPF0337 family)
MTTAQDPEHRRDKTVVAEDSAALAGAAPDNVALARIHSRSQRVPEARAGYPCPGRPPSKEAHMSAMDKMKNKAQELAGEGKEAAGKATDDQDLQAEGHKDQAAGNAKQAGEKVKDIFK